MAFLSLHHARQFGTVLAPLYEERLTGPDWFTRLSEAVNTLMGSELACFEVFDTQGQMVNLGGNAPTLFTPALLQQMTECIQEHPLFRPIFLDRNPDPLRLSDLCPSRQFFRTAVYNECYRRINIRHQLIVGFAVPGLGFASCAFSRSHRDFTETERTLLAFLQPHLAALLRPAAAAPCCPGSLGLTPRETEILDHLARGREDKEIAYRCGISARTVQVHLRNLYAKLGVVNRTAAVRRVLVPA